jgi:hypothetical protein
MIDETQHIESRNLIRLVNESSRYFQIYYPIFLIRHERWADNIVDRSRWHLD